MEPGAHIMAKGKTTPRLEIVVPSEEWLESLRQAAAAADRSLSSYIRTAISAAMRKDGFGQPDAVKPPHRPKGKK